MAPNSIIRPVVSIDDDDDSSHNNNNNNNNIIINNNTATAAIDSSSSSIHTRNPPTEKNGFCEKQQNQSSSSVSSPTVTTTQSNGGSVYPIVFAVLGMAATIGYSLHQLSNVSFDLVAVKKVMPMILLPLGTLLIYFFVVYNTIWLLSMIISIGLDDIYTTTANVFGGRSSGKRPSAQADRTVAERPATIGYHQQIQLLSGIVMYSTALLILVYSDTLHQTSYTEQQVGTSTWSENNTIFNTFTVSLLGTEYKGLLFHVVGIIGVYNVFEYVWMPFLTTYGNFRERSLHGLRLFESTALVPIVLLTAFIVQDPLELSTFFTIDKSIVYNTIRTVLYGWIIFKLIDFTYQYITNQRTIRTPDYPKVYEDTPLTKKRFIIEKSDTDMIDYTTTLAGSKEAKDVWNIYGKQYDVAAFVPYHPGGVESIMLAANRDDATALFQSYHPFNIKKARAVLEKYRVDSKDDTKTKPTSSVDSNNNDFIQYGHEEDIFYDVLCQRVAKVLQNDYNIHPIRDRGADNLRLTSYVIYLAIAFYTSYRHCQGSILYTVLFAVFGDICGAHIGHDGGHFAISSKYPRINDIGVWAFFIVTNPITWQHQHTYAHHSFTNHEDKDPDLHHFKGTFKLRPNEELGNPFMNTIDTLHSLDKERKYFFWLLIFVFSQIASGLSYFFPWVFVMDRSYHGVVGWSDRRQWHRTIQLVTHWVLFVTVIFIAPFMAHAKTNPWMGLMQTSIHLTISSMIFAFVTQVGHLSDVALNNESIAKELQKRHPIARNSWAAEQIVTTQDFAPRSYISFFFGGGLGLQIEHHLFPGFNHCHLTKIQPIVEATCQEYNVTYTKYETWYEAWNVTVNYLTDLARNE